MLQRSCFPLFLDSSEDELQGELKNARRAGRENLTFSTTRSVVIRHPEIHIVEYIEELGAELHRGLLRGLCGLKEAEVGVEEFGASQDVLPRIPKCADGIRHEL